MHDLIQKSIAYDRAVIGLSLAVLLTVAVLFACACIAAFVWGAITKRPKKPSQ